MKFALLYFYDPAHAGPAEGEVSDWLALDAAIKEARARVYRAGFDPQSTARTLTIAPEVKRLGLIRRKEVLRNG